jgi:hypothetical protein
MRRRLAVAFVVALVLAGASGPSRPGASSLPVELVIPSHDPHETAEFGGTLASGDIDADGIEDLVVASTGTGALNGGEVSVYSGATGALMGTLYSTQPQNGPRFGRSLATGDIDGDGYDDVVVGSPGASAPGFVTTGGEVAVFYGPELTESRLLYDPAPQQVAAFGISVAAGDVNGDGYDEVVAGAWDSNVPPFLKAGEAFVFAAPTLTAVTRLTSAWQARSRMSTGMASATSSSGRGSRTSAAAPTWAASSCSVAPPSPRQRSS